MPQKRKELIIEGSNLWYLVGLIASDGCLSGDGRHVDITSSDRGFLEALRQRLDFRNKITVKNKKLVNKAFRVQLSNRNLYEFLLSVGLMPRKSLVLKRLDIPQEFFNDFLRGFIDGDGSLRSWLHPTNHCEQWSLRIYSGSEDFIIWLQAKIREYFTCYGKIHASLGEKRPHTLYTLKYGKLAARSILKRCYYPKAFGLNRKIKLARRCFETPTGWTRSKTLDSGLS